MMNYEKSPIKDEDAMARPGVKMTEVISAVSRYYHVRPEEMVARRRNKEIILPRHVAMYLCAKLTPNSYPQIGARFGRDHTTALYASRKIHWQIQTDTALCLTVRELTLRLKPAQREAAE